MDVTATARRLLESVPAHRTAGIQVLLAADGVARLTLTAPGCLSTSATGEGSLHVGGLVTLLDATGLAAVIASCTSDAEVDDLVPLGASATLDFRAPGRGRLVCECTMDDDARVALRRVLAGEIPRARIGTLSEIVDGTGAVICSGTFRWNVRARRQGPDGAPTPARDLAGRFPPLPW